MKTSFLSKSELLKIGFAHVGENVRVSRFAHFYGAETISLGSNCRVDDFCILSGEINIGQYSHIAAYTALYGSGKICVGDFSGLSPRCTVFSAMDDFSGQFLIGPTLPAGYTNVTKGQVIIGNYCQIGSGSIVFPNLSIGEGSVVGAMSLVKNALNPWGIYAGNPAVFLKERKKDVLNFHAEKLLK